MLSLLLFQRIAELFLIIFMGWLVVKVGILKTEDSRCLSMILLYVITPSVFFNAFQIERTPEVVSMMGFSAILAVTFNAVMLLLARLAAVVFHMDVVEEASSGYPNSGNMAIPLVNAIFGPEWVVFVTLYNMIQNLFVWTHCRMFMSGERKISLKKILWNINIMAILLGAALFFLDIRLPQLLSDTLTSVSSMLGPTAMLIVGMLMADLKLEDLKGYRRIWKPILFRLVVLPLALVFLTRLLHVSSMNPQGETLVLVALIPAFAPAANVVAQFSQIYDLDAKYAGLINAVTMLLCIVTMPLLIAVYQM
ncbi:MAG: AEC family transporter [Clostridiales bacterium]|nr:AEC family transporter [Clostridiales bacterium]